MATSAAPLVPLPLGSSDEDLEAVGSDGHGATVAVFNEGQGADTDPSDEVDAVCNDGHGLLPVALLLPLLYSVSPLELLESAGCGNDGHGVFAGVAVAGAAVVASGTAGAAGASVATGGSVAAGASVAMSVVVEPAALVVCGSDGHGVLPVSASDATTPAFPAADRSVLPKVMELVSTAPTLADSTTQVVRIIASFVTRILRCLIRSCAASSQSAPLRRLSSGQPRRWGGAGVAPDIRVVGHLLHSQRQWKLGSAKAAGGRKSLCLPLADTRQTARHCLVGW